VELVQPGRSEDSPKGADLMSGGSRRDGKGRRKKAEDRGSVFGEKYQS